MQACKKYFLLVVCFFWLPKIQAEREVANPAIEKPIVVIIPSYNNNKWFEKNLDSVFSQNYGNFRVIYINDCSPDGTGDLIADYFEKHKDQFNRVTLINNPRRQGALANLYNAIHTCNDNEIIVTLDGDDWFAQENALLLINSEYQDPNVWLTYGQFQFYPRPSLGFCRKIPEYIFRDKRLRSYHWVTSHPRTFYAWLFKKIKKSDLMHEGIFFKMTWDQAMMFPMVEMAGPSRIRFIPDILYIHNKANPINDGKVDIKLCVRLEHVIRKKRPYSCLPG